ncbi:MAG: hypothetical protein ACI9OJ_005609, partial [Myxococcota bacterium]
MNALWGSGAHRSKRAEMSSWRLTVLAWVPVSLVEPRSEPYRLERLSRDVLAATREDL